MVAGLIPVDAGPVVGIEKPFGGKILHADCVRTFSGLHLVHGFVVAEERVPLLSGRELSLGLGRPDLEQLLKSGQFDRLHVQLGQNLIHGAVIFDLGLKTNEFQGRFGDLRS